MRILREKITEDRLTRDTTLVPPLSEILAVVAMFAGVMAVFA